MRVVQKWRPSLALVLGGTLLAVLILPLVGLALMPAMAGMLGQSLAVGVIVVVVVGVTAILAWLLLRLILRPLRELTRRADAIVAGDPGAIRPLDHYGTAEGGHLGQAVLGMADALQARETVIRSYTDHVTHELRTPLAAIKGSAELLEDIPDLPADAVRRIATIKDAEARMEHLLDAARRIARARMPLPAGQSRISALAARLADQFPQVSVDHVGDDADLPMHAEALELILGHLVQNAVEAGARRVSLRCPEPHMLLVENDGAPVADGNRSRMFDPFFTTRRDAGGTGMGLAIVDAMLSAAGAAITLEAGQERTMFRLDFEAARRARPA